MGVISYISSLFWVNKCFWCQKSGHFFCPQCSSDLELYSPYCYVCKKTSDDFTVHKQCSNSFFIRQVIVLTRYRHTQIKKLMRHAKYYKKYRAYHDLIFPNADFFRKYIHSENSILVPVPMHFLRRWKRGYNQSEKIAQNVSKICGVPVENNFIIRRRYTKQQSHLSQQNRVKNLSWAFSLKDITNVDKNSTIYLVDDVISTGSTVLEITRLLHKNGYKKVKVICLASD